MITAFVVCCIIFSIKIIKYKKSSYYQSTHNSYLSVLFDKGKYGEYLLYNSLSYLENIGAKFLFNVYIPKENFETTEIDMIMICPKGIFVFESKNYSGWIFGTENQKSWYQTLPTGRRRSHKEAFYNPIMQNASHIRHLKTLLNTSVPMHSIIVFSNECTLMNIKINSNSAKVVQRRNADLAISYICKQSAHNYLNESDILNIYNKLYPFTQVDKIAKEQHIANIQNRSGAFDSYDQPYNTKYSTANYTDTHDISASISDTFKNYNIVTPNSDFENYNIVTPNSDFENYDITTTNIPHQGTIIQNTQSQPLRCPRCGKRLTVRSVSKGENKGKKFYGCSDFPNCRYTQNINYNNKG